MAHDLSVEHLDLAYGRTTTVGDGVVEGTTLCILELAKGTLNLVGTLVDSAAFVEYVRSFLAISSLLAPKLGHLHILLSYKGASDAYDFAPICRIERTVTSAILLVWLGAIRRGRWLLLLRVGITLGIGVAPAIGIALSVAALAIRISLSQESIGRVLNGISQRFAWRLGGLCLHSWCCCVLGRLLRLVALCRRFRASETRTCKMEEMIWLESTKLQRGLAGLVLSN